LNAEGLFIVTKSDTDFVGL